MSDTVANLLVALAIAVSACYCAWHLGPRRMRDALRARLHKILPSFFADAKSPTAASGCDACAGCHTAAPGSNSQPRNTFVLKRR